MKYKLFAIVLFAAIFTGCRDETSAPSDPKPLSAWSLDNSNTISTLIETHFRDALNGVAVGMEGTVITTTDGGRNWTPRTKPQAGALYGVHFFDANNGIVVGDGQNIYRTTNAGQSWTSSALGTWGKLRGLHFTSPTNGFVLVSNDDVGGGGEIWRTQDGGDSWTLATLSTGGMYCIAFANQSRGVAFGKGGVVLVTNNGGVTWIEGSMPISGHTLHVTYVDGPTAVAVGGNSDPESGPGYIVRSTDGGLS